MVYGMLLDEILNKYIAGMTNRRSGTAPFQKLVCYRGVCEKPGKIPEYKERTGMLREGYDPPISRSPEAKTRDCTSEPYESGALTS